MLSVIIPVYNRPRQVLLAVNSVLRQHSKEMDVEIIIVDDHSAPPLSLERPSVKLLRLARNSGPASARNAGILAASGELIAFVDSDDVWLADKMASEAALLRESMAVEPQRLHAVTCGFYYASRLNGRLRARIPRASSRVIDFAGGCWFSPGSTLLLHRTAFSEVGLFDERLRCLEDLDWFIRFGQLGGHLHVVPEPRVIVFRHSDPNREKNVKDAAHLIQKKFGSNDATRLASKALVQLKAYLCLARASAAFDAGHPFRSLLNLARSFAIRPRSQLSVERYFTEQQCAEPLVAMDYEAMIRCARAACDILVVVDTLRLGGTERHLSLVLPALQARGYVVKIYNISGDYDSEIRHSFLNAGVEILSPGRSNRTSYHHGLRTFERLAGLFGLARAYRLEQPRIVHFYLPRAYIAGAALACLARVPLRIMSRRSMNFYQTNHPLLAKLERLLHSTMTAIVGNSLRVIEQLRDEEGVSPDRLRCIYNGIGIEPFNRPFASKQKRQELALLEGTFVLITVANLIAYKGHHDLMDALASIRLNLPQPWVLLVVGRDEGVQKDLEERAAKLCIAENIRFLGERHDVVELMRISQLGLLCSHQEGFSNAILEGMAASLPMIVTDVGGNAEAILDGVTGLVVPKKNPQALARAILRLASEPQVACQMGLAARERVEEIFSLDTCVTKYEELYNSLGVRPSCS